MVLYLGLQLGPQSGWPLLVWHRVGGAAELGLVLPLPLGMTAHPDCRW